MSAASYSRTSRPRTDRVSYGRSSAGRASAASGYRGARYVSSSLAEELSFEEAPSISVVPGAGRRAQSEGISAAALSLAKACAVICIVIALIAMARVAITSAAASCALETRSLQTSIETARAEGNELEVSQSVLANPSRIKAQATALGMAAPAPEYSEQYHAVSRYRRHRRRRQPVAVGVGGAHEGALIPWNATATPTEAAAAAVPMPRAPGASADAPSTSPGAPPRARPGPRPPRGVAALQAATGSAAPRGARAPLAPARAGVGAAIDAAMPTVSGRAKVLLLVFAAIAAVFFLRLVFLQVIVSGQYSAMAEESRTVSFETTPRRGTIYDRNGIVLATSVEATTIYANPVEVTDAAAEAAAPASVLGGDAADYRELLSTPSTTFVYIKRQADVDVADKVKELKLDGVYFIADTRREYPNGAIGGQVIGYCNVDGEGITGLELQYNDILSGDAGHLHARGARPRAGIRPFPAARRDAETPAVDGQDIDRLPSTSELHDNPERGARLTARGSEGARGSGGSAIASWRPAAPARSTPRASLPLHQPGRHVLDAGG